MNANYPTPYLVGRIFHFRFTSRMGLRQRLSTGFSRKTDAERFIREFIDKQRPGIDTTTTVRDALKLYQDAELNPKKKPATVTKRTSTYHCNLSLHFQV